MTAEKRGFEFHTPEGDMDLTIYEVKELAGRDDPDRLYALGMAYLYGWDIEDQKSPQRPVPHLGAHVPRIRQDGGLSEEHLFSHQMIRVTVRPIPVSPVLS